MVHLEHGAASHLVSTQACSVQPLQASSEGDFGQEQISPTWDGGYRNILQGVLTQTKPSQAHGFDTTDPDQTQNWPQADLHPVADYKCFNRSNVSIRPWSWNYRSCWHQTCPPVATHHCVWIASITSSAGSDTSRIAAVRRCLTLSFGIGQFARLLPTLVVVAVSQAASPESNPNSPLPVIATVVHYTTVRADRSEVRAVRQAVVEPLCKPELSPEGPA